MKRVVLFLKGVCMGVADIIPGVSGGTLALILGIYAELVNTIKGLHLRWVPQAFRWVRSGFSGEERRKLLAELREMNLFFLLTLGAGIACAIAAGGLIIPTLLERYPEVMRALFFGLIVASVGVPFRMITFSNSTTRVLVGVMIVLGVGLGWLATAPHRTFEATTTWAVLEAEEQETLKDISRRAPSAWPAESVYWAEQNEALRQVIEAHYEGLELVAPGSDAAQDKDAVRARSEVYEALEIPPGTPVQIPQPAMWFIFLAGMICICAMILPGISGSYLLLILGAYYFVLNALKGVITGLASLSIPPVATIYVVLFCVGAAIGLLSFARVMSYLLRVFPAATLGFLVGLMVGCLRGIWPFRTFEDGRVVNALPTALDSTVLAVGVAALVGAALVMVLTRVGRRHEEERFEAKS